MGSGTTKKLDYFEKCILKTVKQRKLFIIHYFDIILLIIIIKLCDKNGVNCIIENNINNNLTMEYSNLDQDNLHKLQQIVMEGLGLTKIPDVNKINISQEEYAFKYKLYLEKVRHRQMYESNNDVEDFFTQRQLFSFKHLYNDSNIRHLRKKRSLNSNSNDLVYILFNLPNDELLTDIEEATLRLMINSHSKNNLYLNNRQNSIQLKIYQLVEPYGRIWLDTYKINLENTKSDNITRWIEFDVSKAVESWMSGKRNLGLEIHCEGCDSNNVHIIHDTSLYSDPEHSPVLNVLGKVVHREKRSKQHRNFSPNSKRKLRKTDCSKDNQKCCRRSLEVAFKEIKGYEFIIQPKIFDAGYCRGKCPPRYNPAHHHALLQSLIWKQDRTKVPKPCCAPSKLVELEVLHVDEHDETKLKVSKWSNMRVLECACS